MEKGEKWGWRKGRERREMERGERDRELIPELELQVHCLWCVLYDVMEKVPDLPLHAQPVVLAGVVGTLHRRLYRHVVIVIVVIAIVIVVLFFIVV